MGRWEEKMEKAEELKKAGVKGYTGVQPTYKSPKKDITPHHQTLSMKKIRGYFGVVFFEPKFEENIGTAIRSAHCFGADFIGVIGKRYKRQPTDTMATEKHVPIYEYKDLDDFLSHIPLGCAVIGVECDAVQTLEMFHHPERAIYILGGEDRNLPQEIKTRIKFETSHCVNMAVAASIVLYDRHQKKVRP